MQLPLFLVLAGAVLHPTSLSRSEVRVSGARVTVALRFQALSLLEVAPELERVRDGFLDADELAAGRARIDSYLLASFRLLRVDGADESPLTGRVVALTAEDPALVSPMDMQNVDATLELDSPTPLEVLVVESRLFHESNPWHKDFCSLTWNADDPVPHLFEGAETRWRFEPAHVRGPSVFALYVRLGIEHIFGGFDHQAFLLALLVASRRVRSLVGVVTAFTLAHSITLALAALGVVHVPPRFVELAIALSIAYVACDNLLRREARNPWVEAFVFGLLHGLGFAGFLAETLRGESLVLTALVGFNVGVELGQLSLVLACLLVIALAFRGHRRRARSDPGAGIVPGPVRTVVSIAVALAGFYWFLERAGWLPWT